MATLGTILFDLNCELPSLAEMAMGGKISITTYGMNQPQGFSVLLVPERHREQFENFIRANFGKILEEHKDIRRPDHN